MLRLHLSDEALASITACMLTASLLISASEGRAQPATTPALPPLTYVAQGWSAADRDTFYTTGQGSHMIPYAWFKALRRAEVDEPFAADQLQRYGYLRNDSPKNVEGLPVGFVVESKSGQLGMTCAACHTGQLEYQRDNVTYSMRLDGAPAHADFQQFLVDLTLATRKTSGMSAAALILSPRLCWELVFRRQRPRNSRATSAPGSSSSAIHGRKPSHFAVARDGSTRSA